MELVLPSAKYKDSFIEAVKEFREDNSFPLMHKRYHEVSLDELERDFEGYVERIRSHERGENLPAGFVPVTEFWLVDGDAYIGTAYVRHVLNENLARIGGHIGYDIRPSKRGKGYGNTILELVLPKAKALGISKALLTCDVTNVASRKIIEKNGGVLEDQVPNPETGVDKLRYWIDIK